MFPYSQATAKAPRTQIGFDLMLLLGEGGFGQVYMARKLDGRNRGHTYAIKLTKRPEGETKRPDGETKRPEGETKRPEGETKRPEVETKRPEGETKRPEGETKRPEGETKRPVAQPSHDTAERSVLEALRDCPYVIRLHSAFHTRTHLGLVMDFAVGGDLNNLLEERGPLSESDVRFYLAQLVLGLKAVHAIRVIHRDVKPANVLIHADGYIVLSDFGLAKQFSPDDKIQTMRGNRGTVSYTAPEVAQGECYSYTADWWSLGVTACQMATGRKPFVGETRAEVSKRVVGSFPTIRGDRPLSRALWDLILSMLAKAPHQRLGHDGAGDVMAHDFFDGFDWDALEAREVPAPFMPVY